MIIMIKRQVFFSFEFGKDIWRASQVRNMVSDSSTLFSDNDWENVKSQSDSKIRSWIDTQMVIRKSKKFWAHIPSQERMCAVDM